MKVCVFGAGAIGGHVAARLVYGGAAVSVVARGEQLAAIQARGLTVRTPSETLQAKVTASEDPAALGEQDAVIVTLKAPALPALAASIGPLLGPDTAVVFAMNGIPWWYFHAAGGEHDGKRLDRLDPGGALWSAIGPQRVIGGVVGSACTVVEPGVIEVATKSNVLILGEPDGTLSNRAEALAALLRAGGMQSPAVSDIRTRIWAKLLLNLGANPMGVLARASLAEVVADPACCDALHRTTAEIQAVAAALGCHITADPDGNIAMFRQSRHVPSIVQDLRRGRPMEIEAIFATPLELARMVGVPTPTLDLLVGLAKLRARGAGLYA